ncbi:hypothetical protein DIS24_g10037 [Lasiodiplodia hormozganensis]|uniref:Uncharacterized protein n=1 Tax=Lasiodiplodia hormozganensis TaxID=869390 RepID=A0AA40CHZ8_9PEZI|nr:hypothetical protein DIS24_g10037 [Lasiodiplodia hormozganensis]
MKFNVGIMFAAVAFTRVFSVAVPDDAADECGSLGVMSLDDIPEDARAGEVRKCAGHPLGQNRPLEGTALEPMDGTDNNRPVTTSNSSAAENAFQSAPTPNGNEAHDHDGASGFTPLSSRTIKAGDQDRSSANDCFQSPARYSSPFLTSKYFAARPDSAGNRSPAFVHWRLVYDSTIPSQLRCSPSPESFLLVSKKPCAASFCAPSPSSPPYTFGFCLISLPLFPSSPAHALPISARRARTHDQYIRCPDQYNTLGPSLSSCNVHALFASGAFLLSSSTPTSYAAIHQEPARRHGTLSYFHAVRVVKSGFVAASLLAMHSV